MSELFVEETGKTDERVVRTRQWFGSASSHERLSAAGSRTVRAGVLPITVVPYQGLEFELSVIPAQLSVIPARISVIPAQAGIHVEALDSRLRGNDELEGQELTRR